MKKTFLLLSAFVVSLSLLTGCDTEPAKVESTTIPPETQADMDKTYGGGTTGAADPAATPPK